MNLLKIYNEFKNTCYSILHPLYDRVYIYNNDASEFSDRLNLPLINCAAVNNIILDSENTNQFYLKSKSLLVRILIKFTNINITDSTTSMQNVKLVEDYVTRELQPYLNFLEIDYNFINEHYKFGILNNSSINYDLPGNSYYLKPPNNKRFDNLNSYVVINTTEPNFYGFRIDNPGYYKALTTNPTIEYNHPIIQEYNINFLTYAYISIFNEIDKYNKSNSNYNKIKYIGIPLLSTKNIKDDTLLKKIIAIGMKKIDEYLNQNNDINIYLCTTNIKVIDILRYGKYL
jgi:hypothetical protein